MQDASSPPVEPESPSGRRRRSPYRRPPGRPLTHGAGMLTRVLRTVPLDTIDGRSQAGVYLRRVRDELIAQRGGPDAVTPAVALIIEEAAKTALIVKATGDYILSQQSLIQDGSLLPVVTQREALVGSLLRMLTTLGLERSERRIDVVAELARMASEGGPTTSSHPAAPGAEDAPAQTAEVRVAPAELERDAD